MAIIEFEKSIVDKVKDGDEITKKDLQGLNMFNDAYIDLLVNASRETIECKVIEALTREGITEIKCHSTN